MSTLKNGLALLLTAAALSVAGIKAQAATLSASALLDLGTLSFTTVTGDATLALTDKHFHTGTSGPLTSDSAGVPIPLASASVFDVYPNGSAHADGLADTHGLGSSGVYSSAVVTDAGWAFASASSEFDYLVTATESSIVKLTIDWYLINDLTGPDLDPNAHTGASFFVQQYDIGGDEFLTKFKQIGHSGTEGALSDAQSGTLMLLLILEPGAVGTLHFGVNAHVDSAVAPVPIPPALALLGSAVVGLVSVRRRTLP